MSRDLPALSLDLFARRLSGVSPEELTEATVEALYAHYEELRRWNRRLSLVGPGTLGTALERHYGEALAALSVVPRGPLVHVDLGSGGGFPGFVLAAARPAWRTTLVESRERKWAFLQAAARRAGLSVECLDVRVERPLPESLPGAIDLITVRALRVPVEVWAALGERLARGARVVLWEGDAPSPLPAGWVREREVTLGGSRARRLVRVRPGE